MKGRKIITILIIVNLILVGIICNLINKGNVNNQKQILKEMTETEYENTITELNQSYEDYAKNIKESKKKIASAITEKGVKTSNEETLENMANNIKNIFSINENALLATGTFKTSHTSVKTLELGFRPKLLILEFSYDGTSAMRVILDCNTLNYVRYYNSGIGLNYTYFAEDGTPINVTDTGISYKVNAEKYAQSTRYYAIG